MERFGGEHVLFIVTFDVTFNKLKRRPTPKFLVISFGRAGSLLL